MNAPKRESYNVLIADDSESDRFLLKAAMRVAPRLRIAAEVATGTQVIEYFNGQAGFDDRERFPLPDLLLLDLKMPAKDGFEVLEWLRERSFSDLKVVVLTDSMQPQHIKRALDLGADMFQVKPRATRDREALVLALEEDLLASSVSPLTHSRVRSVHSWA